MNKEVIELKEKRAGLIETMNSIVDLAYKEKRKKTKDEQKTFNESDDSIKKLDGEIIEAERMEALNKTVKPKNTPEPEIDKIKRRYDGGKALNSLRGNKTQTGLEAEIDQEARNDYSRVLAADPNAMYIPEWFWDKKARADFAYSSATNDYDTDNLGLDINVSPSLYGRLGVTVYNNLKAKTTLNFEDGNTSLFTNEGSTLTESTPTRTNATLDPRRVGGKKGFSNELLSVSNFFNQQLADMVSSIDRAISKEVLSQGVLANIASDFQAADAKAKLTWSAVSDLGKDLEIDDFVNQAYVMSQQVYSSSRSIVKDAGSGAFIVEPQGIFGIPAYGSSQLAVHDSDKYDLIFGDWARAHVGFFGGAMEVLIDPYTDGATGVTNIIFNRLSDVVVNVAGFESYRNIDIA